MLSFIYFWILLAKISLGNCGYRNSQNLSMLDIWKASVQFVSQLHFMCVCACVCVCVRVCQDVCVYVCVYVCLILWCVSLWYLCKGYVCMNFVGSFLYEVVVSESTHFINPSHLCQSSENRENSPDPWHSTEWISTRSTRFQLYRKFCKNLDIGSEEKIKTTFCRRQFLLEQIDLFKTFLLQMFFRFIGVGWMT